MENQSSGQQPIRLKIGELSKLYNIGVDSIRYYEKVGILNPIRNEQNNYRMYTSEDLRKLTMIRELLNLNFSTEQIRNYDANRNVETTEKMLLEELRIVKEQIKTLKEKKANLKSRLQSLEESKSIRSDQTIHLEHLPAQDIFMLSTDRIPDNYVDYTLIQYMYKSKTRIDTIGASDCYILDLEKSRPNSDYLWTKSVFFYSDALKLPVNDQLPEGDYLRLWYHGSAKKTRPLVFEMLDYAASHSYKIIGDPIEFCIVDDYETTVEEEFLTELRIRVERK